MSPLSWKSINNLETIFLFTFLRNRLPKKKCGQALVKNAWCSIFYLHLLFVFSIEVLLHQIIRLTGCSMVVKFTLSYYYNVCCCIWIFYGPWNGKHTVQKRNWKPFQGVGCNLHFISFIGDFTPKFSICLLNFFIAFLFDETYPEFF